MKIISIKCVILFCEIVLCCIFAVAQLHKHNIKELKKPMEHWPGNVQELCNHLLQEKKFLSDSQKAYQAYKWITTHINYDPKGAEQSVLGIYDSVLSNAGNVLRLRKGTCWGFSKLYKNMCDCIGVHCEVVYGYIRGFYIKDEQYDGKEYHAWNILTCNGKKFQVDCTYGMDRRTDYNKRRSLNTMDTLYFCAKPERFILDHFADSVRDNIGFEKTTLDRFMALPFFDPDYFQFFSYTKSDLEAYFNNNKLSVGVFFKNLRGRKGKILTVFLQPIEKCDIEPFPTDTEAPKIKYTPQMFTNLPFHDRLCYQTAVEERTITKYADGTDTDVRLTYRIARIYGR